MSAEPSPPVPDRPRSGWAPVLLRLYPAAWRARYGDELADLIGERRLSLRGALDLLRGALDAHCNLADLLGEWSAMTSRLRSAAVTTFTAWVLFCVAAAGLVKSTEDRAFVSAARGHAALGVSYVVVQGAFVLAGLAVLVGGLPAALVAVRQAWRDRDTVLARLLGVPVLAAVAVVAYALLAVRLAPPTGVHRGVTVALFAGLLLVAGAGTVSTAAAVRAATHRVELPIGLLRWVGWAALVAAGAISGGVAALAIYGWALRTEEPALFGSANGVLATPLPVTYLVMLILGIIAALRADRAAVGALRALRGGHAWSDESGTATCPSDPAPAGPPGAHRTVSAISRRDLRLIIRVVAAAVVLLLVGMLTLLGYAKIQSGRSVTIPEPTGPDRVGRAAFDWTDHSRADPYAPSGSAESTPRELSVLVWYPAAPTPNVAATSYQPPGWDQVLGNEGISTLVRTAPSRIHPHAVADAPVASGAPHPVLVFAPGLGLQAADYTTLAEDLASHGYVVAGINPTYSTDVVLTGGRVVRSVDHARDDADLPKLVQLWADDLRFVARQMQELGDTPGGPFQGHLDTTRIGLFGHSAGGAAATQACHHDPSCPAALDIDGYLFGDVLHDGLGKPFGFLGNQNSLTEDPYQHGMVRAVLRGVPPRQGHVWTVAGASHFNFTDRSVYFNLLAPQLGILGPIDGARAITITDTYTRAFFDTYLRGQPSPLLDGTSPTYPEVSAEPA